MEKFEKTTIICKIKVYEKVSQYDYYGTVTGRSISSHDELGPLLPTLANLADYRDYMDIPIRESFTKIKPNENI